MMGLANRRGWEIDWAQGDVYGDLELSPRVHVENMPLQYTSFRKPSTGIHPGRDTCCTS